MWLVCNADNAASFLEYPNVVTCKININVSRASLNAVHSVSISGWKKGHLKASSFDKTIFLPNVASCCRRSCLLDLFRTSWSSSKILLHASAELWVVWRLLSLKMLIASRLFRGVISSLSCWRTLEAIETLLQIDLIRSEAVVTWVENEISLIEIWAPAVAIAKIEAATPTASILIYDPRIMSRK